MFTEAIAVRQGIENLRRSYRPLSGSSFLSRSEASPHPARNTVLNKTEGEQNSDLFKGLSLFLEFGSQDERKKVWDFIEFEIRESPVPREAAVGIIGNNLDSEDKDNCASAERLTQVFLARILSPESSQDLIEYWREERIWDDKKHLKRNLKILSRFESSSPGIAKFMVDVVGMKDFSIVDYPANISREEFEYLQNKYARYNQDPSEDFDPWEEERKILEHYNISNTDDFLNAWKVGRPRLVASSVRENISHLIALEKERPGIAGRLSREFGIKYFARYPKDFLIRQYDEMDRVDLPYSVLAFARKDRTGAFSNRVHFIQDLDEQFQHLKDENGNSHKYALRVVEIGSTLDIRRLLLRLRGRYGKWHRISSPIVIGHGDTDLIHLGEDELRNYLYSSNLVGKGSRRAKEFFEENPTFILGSCKTGIPDGIGQKLSEAMGATVVAPPTSTRLRSVTAEIHEGKLVYTDVVYKNGESGNRYVSGELRKVG